MIALAWYLAVVVCAVALVAAHLAFWTWYYHRPREPDERHFVRTADGWTVALSRLRPDPAGAAGGVPVLCCPGLACNARLFDFDDEHSLGRHLAERGFDVWMLDLRGAGHSQKPQWPETSWDFGFDEFVHQDACAAVTYVVGATGRDRLLWVGHSMGGLIGYHVGARCDEGRHVAAVASIGSPLDFSGHREALGWVVFVLDWFLPRWPVARLSRLCRLLSPLAGWVRSFPETLFMSGRNVPGLTVRRFMVEVIVDVPRRLLKQFADSILRGQSLDGQPFEASMAGLGAFDRPVLAISGNLDRMAPPTSVRVATHLLGSEDATEVVVGHEDEVAFGHGDLIVGEAAPTAVYPLVSEWLLARA